MEGKKAGAKYCSHNCASKASYHRNKMKQEQQQLQGIPSYPAQTQIQPPLNGWGMTLEQYIIRDLEKKNEKLEKEFSDVNSKYEALKNEHDQIRQENAFKDREHSLVIRENEITQTKGLSGIVDQVGSNPELLGIATTVLGRLFGANEEAKAKASDNQYVTAFSEWFLGLNPNEQKRAWAVIHRLSIADHLEQQAESILKFLQDGTARKNKETNQNGVPQPPGKAPHAE